MHPMRSFRSPGCPQYVQAGCARAIPAYLIDLLQLLCNPCKFCHEQMLRNSYLLDNCPRRELAQQDTILVSYGKSLPLVIPQPPHKFDKVKWLPGIFRRGTLQVDDTLLT